VRNPLRGESDAFHVAIGCAVLTGVSLGPGSLFDRPAGAGR
jgi:hypothetical protein